MAQAMAQNMFRISQVSLNNVVRCNAYAFAPATSQAKAYSSASTTDKEKSKNPIQKSVFISQSTDIFTNLALEDWMYRNFNFNNHHVLLMWRNSPCVVIGRHQNPWVETNTTNVAHQGMEIARRNSGGGTVYHDRGNLNLTFFTKREEYNRRNNLEIVSRALFREWGIESVITPREDIVVKNTYKQQISGTAAKLGRPNAYHHCTLLVDVNKVALRQSLHKDDKGIVTNATQSVASPIMNLCEINQHVKVERMLGAVGWEYLRTCPETLEDGGQDLINKQRGFQLINPTDNWFPGLNKLKEELSSWDWRFGKTPKFQVNKSFRVPKEFLGEGEMGVQELKVSLEVNKGIIDDVTLKLPPGLLSTNGFHGEVDVVTSLRGQPFSERAVVSLENALHDMSTKEGNLQGKSQFVMNCMRQVMQSV
ncbi:hypothetical protein R5R35_005357 [Gryllus longicercus]|uniref:BPL/LPL catalytic domain-containing protein n=1 Tax=Gryllus longicercus TaxID=2509291 RepID=A0AAN9VF22_9ORTH